MFRFWAEFPSWLARKLKKSRARKLAWRRALPFRFFKPGLELLDDRVLPSFVPIGPAPQFGDPPGSGSPTGGTVTFYATYNGVTSVLAVVAATNAVTPVFTNLGMGQHEIVAVFSGDSNLLGSTSAVFTQLIVDPPHPQPQSGQGHSGSKTILPWQAPSQNVPHASPLTPCPPLLEWRTGATCLVQFGPRGAAAMKCQKCTKAATLHITEVLGDDQYDELHLCEECAQKYLYEPQQKGGAGKSSEAAQAEESEEAAALNQRECPVCGVKFVEFRNSGRLGCPHDYQEFREELLPLLENIHGDVKHVGKTPRRLPQTKQTQAELIQLRKQLQQAVTREAYEEAARLRDRIRQLEES